MLTYPRKLVISLLLSSGIFVIAAALIRVILTVSGSPSALNINRWGVRETIVGIFTVNIPVLRPMFNRDFWTRNPTLSTTDASATKSSRGPTISGPYELTSRGQDGPMDLKTQDGSSTNDSQERIFAKGEHGGVMVHTSYKITTDEETGTGSWNQRPGFTEVSVQSGAKGGV
jgi:hypothetical protein